MVNKTFLLNDFFTSHALDILFITETWIKPGELSPFTELVPHDCNFFNSPRLSGRGGGLAAVFRNSYSCRCLSSSPRRTFELLLLQPVLNVSVLFVLIYRPPQPNKDFLTEFAEFLGDIVTSYDRILILGDFNIHVCCDSKLLSKEFRSLIDSFDFDQWVSGPTHIQGHTLDLLLSRGLPVLDINILDTGLSDHLPVLFSLLIPRTTSIQQPPSRLIHVFSDFSSTQFTASYSDLCAIQDMDSCSSYQDADDHLDSFYSSCTAILNVVAPLKLKKHKHNSKPWLNETTRLLRQTCRRAERKWNKDRLQVSYEILKDSLHFNELLKLLSTLISQS